MSETYDWNEFDEVVTYNCGQRMDNGRQPTDMETQQRDELKELQIAHDELHTESCHYAGQLSASRKEVERLLGLGSWERDHRERYQAERDEANEKYGDLQAENERLQDALDKIHQWCKAYPRTVFIEPTEKEWEQIRDVLNYNGLSLDAVSGSCMRHVVERWTEITEEALKGGEA